MVLLVGVFVSVSVAAEPQSDAVDLELVLAVDVSSSMSLAEQRLQRDGYISAFRHPDIARAIQLGSRGMIAVSYVEWAGPKYQRVVLSWTIISNHDEAKRFAEALATQPIAREAGTSISGGLLLAHEMFASRSSTGQRRVIDVSGDGPNNAGLPVAPVRDMLTASGITINGLPMSLPRDHSYNFETFGEDYLKSYFEHCVIGGPDAFVIGIDDISQFEGAIRNKLFREIAGAPPRTELAAYIQPPHPTFDCLTIGQAPGR